MPVVPAAAAVGCTPDMSVGRPRTPIRATQVVPAVDRSPQAAAEAEAEAARAESVELVRLGHTPPVLVGLVALLEPTTTQTGQQAVSVSGFGPEAVAVVPRRTTPVVAARLLAAGASAGGTPAEQTA